MTPTLMAALISAVMSLLTTEAPVLRTNQALHDQFRSNVTELTALHVDVAQEGLLVSPDVDAVLLASVNYAESRFRLPPGRGDCYETHPYRNVPSLRWPKGYVPKMKKVCPALGPMQVAQGNRFVVGEWSEVTELLPGIQKTPLTLEQMEDPRTNITLSYGILNHWKNACPNKKAVASAASWLTAYRWGKCTPQHWNKRYFDAEAKLRCARFDRMVEAIRAAGVEFAVPEGWSCMG